MVLFLTADAFAQCTSPTITTNSPICTGNSAIFTITGTPGDIVSYSLNSTPTQTITIGTNGSVPIIVNNAITNQNLSLSYVLGSTICSMALTDTATISVGSATTPTFAQVSPICIGGNLNPLPTVSFNGIAGTWSPAINNMQTTTYTFMPTSTACETLASMTITVNPASITPTFTPVAAICSGQVLNPLPSTSINGYQGSWSPAMNNTQTTTYTFTPVTGSCAVSRTMTITVKPIGATPTFAQVAPVCSGQPLASLPVTSTNGITGTWSPAINNIATTTYTFTASTSTASCYPNTTMTVQVNPNQTPGFTQVAPINPGDPLNPLPTVSVNGISGSWSPAVNNQTTTTYTFTPAASSCAGQVQMVIVVIGTTPILCGDSTVCNGNTGLYSNDNATDIAYDNMGAAFHASYIKEPNGQWKVWGANMLNSNGNSLSPTSLNVANYPALTGTIYKLAIGSGTFGSNSGGQQLLVLTSTGLFVSGDGGSVISPAITTSGTLHRITVNGKTDGLPLNILPGDVKMLFASTATVIITTCAGEVYVLSQNGPVRGNPASVNGLQWSKVMQNSSTPLTNVIVSRGCTDSGYALKADGTLWTWGNSTFLGDGSNPIVRSYATQMTLPAGLSGVKMIQATSDNGSGNSYYILGFDKKVYSLGFNGAGQLGDRTTTTRNIWVNAKNTDSTIITDAAWISANEHDWLYPGLGVIKAGGVFYTAGYNSYYMVGRAVSDGTNYLALPAGIAGTDVITHVEVGGHSTAVIRLGSIRYGYVGHRINGSMGDGSSLNQNQQSFDFITPPIVAVCGTICTPPTVTTNGPLCPGANAIFTISGLAGDIVTYSINGASSQNVTIGAGGSVAVTVNNIAATQTILLSYILGATGSCSNNLSISAMIAVSGTAVPTFTQVAPICLGGTIAALPLTSLNGITGTWSPAIDATQTTTYTFTGTSGGTCVATSPTTMTIAVFPPNSVPIFTQAPALCFGQTVTPLPTTSNNGAVGTWSPAIDNTVTTTYTFTPTGLGCVVNATMTIPVFTGVVPAFTQVAPICQFDVVSALPTISTNLISGTWSPAFNNNTTTTYTFTPAVNSCATTVQMTVVVNTKETPTFTQVAPVCEGTVMSNLPLTSLNAITGTWSPALNNAATTTYTFTPATGSCAFTAPMTIAIIPKVMPLFAAPADICFGDMLYTLPTTSSNGITGTWSPAFNNTLTGTYTFTPAITECAHPTTMQIVVFEDYDFDILQYCENGSLMLSVVPKFNSFDLSSSGFNWQYNNLPVATTPIFNVTAFLNSTTATEPLPLAFSTTVTDANGCAKSKPISVPFVYCDIQKGISPNKDGFNEFFDLRLLDVRHLSIFNRYGVKVYSQDNYYDQWVGQTDDGTILPDATYYYQIEFNNGPLKTGWIYINREQ